MAGRGTLTPYGHWLLLGSTFAPDVIPPLDDAWLALTTAPAMIGDDGAHLVEPADLAYARMALPMTSLSWTASGYAAITNAVDVVFPVPTLGWGQLRGWALVTEPGQGALIAIGELIGGYAPNPGDTVTVSAAALRIELSGSIT